MSYSTIGLPLVHAMPIFYMAFFFLAAMVPVAVGGVSCYVQPAGLEVSSTGDITFAQKNINKYAKVQCAPGLQKCIQLFGCKTTAGDKLDVRGCGGKGDCDMLEKKFNCKCDSCKPGETGNYCNDKHLHSAVSESVKAVSCYQQPAGMKVSPSGITFDKKNIKKYAKVQCAPGLHKCIQMFGCKTDSGEDLVIRGCGGKGDCDDLKKMYNCKCDSCKPGEKGNYCNDKHLNSSRNS